MVGSSKECLSIPAGIDHSDSGSSRENCELSHRVGALPLCSGGGSESALTNQPTGFDTVFRGTFSGYQLSTTGQLWLPPLSLPVY